MKSQTAAQTKKEPDGAAAERRQREKLRSNFEILREVEALARARVGLLLRGAAAELDRACGWIGPVGSDADEVAAAVSAAITALSEIHQDRIHVWKDKLRRLDVAREAWRNAGGTE